MDPRRSCRPIPVLAIDEVRHVGDAVAFVVAQTEDEARAAAEAVEIDWEPLDAVVGIEGAEAEGADVVWPQLPGNVAFDTEVGKRAETDAAFAKADRTISLTVVNNRLVTNYLEPRACIAEYDEGSRRWTITLGSQGSHDIRDILAKHILKVEPERIRVVTPDVGGGFGTKIFMYREYPLCAVAAERLKRPVRWVADRTEHFLGDTQGRDNITTATMAIDKRGKFLGLRIDLKADMGAYLSQFAPFIPSGGSRMSPGCYDIPAVHARIRGYFTHTVPVDAYRGAGRPEAAYVIERFVDHIARELKTTPDAIRALNFIKPEQMPYETATGRIYDSGEFEGHMRRAMEVGEWGSFKERAAAARKAGRARGIGMASYIEACSGGSAENAQVKLEQDGTVTVLIGTQSTGQGHLTAYAQLVSQHLDIPVERHSRAPGRYGPGRHGRRNRRIALDPRWRRVGCQRIADPGRQPQAARRRCASRRGSAIWRSRRVPCGSRAPTAPSPSRISPSARAQRRSSSRCRTAGSRRKPPIRTGRMCARSRSTRTRAKPRWCATPSWTISA
jgi:carbon-monoxide dehydrogenase large subunit